MADPVVAGVEPVPGRGGLGAGEVGLDQGAPVQGAVRPDGVVVAAELIELGLESGDGGGAGLAVEPLLDGLVEPFDLPAGLG